MQETPYQQQMFNSNEQTDGNIRDEFIDEPVFQFPVLVTDYELLQDAAYHVTIHDKIFSLSKTHVSIFHCNLDTIQWQLI